MTYTHVAMAGASPWANRCRNLVFPRAYAPAAGVKAVDRHVLKPASPRTHIPTVGLKPVGQQVLKTVYLRSHGWSQARAPTGFEPRAPTYLKVVVSASQWHFSLSKWVITWYYLGGLWRCIVNLCPASSLMSALDKDITAFGSNSVSAAQCTCLHPCRRQGVC